MGSKVWVMFLLVALALVAESTTLHEVVDGGLTHLGSVEVSTSVEDLTDTLLDSEINRRQLGRKKYISYAALKANSIPCNRRGKSYYNCNTRERANPYSRGCSVITHCYRFTS